MSMDTASLLRSHSAGDYIDYRELDRQLDDIARDIQNLLNLHNPFRNAPIWVVTPNRIIQDGAYHWYLNVTLGGDPTEFLHVTFHSGDRHGHAHLNIGRTHIKYNTPGQQAARINRGQRNRPCHPIFQQATRNQELCSLRIIREENNRFDTLPCDDEVMQLINGWIIYVLNNYALVRVNNKYLKYKTKYLKYKNKYLKLKKKLNL